MIFRQRAEPAPPAAPAAAPARAPGQAEKLVTRLEWTVIRRLDGLLHGDYRSLFRGFGLDLADLREYQYHDDVRRIDWNVTARLGTPYVREYQEDREVDAWFAIDLSASIDFGSNDVRKRSVGAEFVTVLARLLTRHGNRVGALLYGDRVDTVLPARSGRRQVLQLAHALATRPPPKRTGGTKLAELVESTVKVVRRRSLVFVVSDFVSEPGWAKPLGLLARRHEVIAVRLSDPLERAMPNLGMVVVEDAETGEQMVLDTHDRGFRKRFEEAATRREAEIRDAFADAGVDALELATDENLAEAILRFADLRKRRTRLASGGALPKHLEARRVV